MKGVDLSALKAHLPAGGRKPHRRPAAGVRMTADQAYVARLTVTLLVITTVSALLLALVHSQTAPEIEAHNRAKTAAAMAQVLPADSYETVEDFVPTEDVSAISRAVAGGAAVGYVCEVTAGGFDGEIRMVVGVGLDGRVTGVSVIEHSETPNVGTRVTDDPNVLAGFAGLSAPVTVNEGENRFDAVAGATRTARGMAEGVNAALSAAAAYLQ